MTPDPKGTVRVRFAPSPTGPLSLGNVRTALYNWLYAKHSGGEFLLRIEDTDKKRSKSAFIKEIIDGLKWLGLNWDGEIYYQSKRLETYEKYLKTLLREERAYYCFCSREKLEAERQAQLSQGLPPRYSGACRKLTKKEISSRSEKESAVIRFKMPDGEIEFNDIVRGKVSFHGELIGDFVIARDLKHPLYNFAVVVDDEKMEITHVIRGEDHIPNTPKQIALGQALGFDEPHYAHLPLILGPDRRKLSKRFLERSFLEYKKEGYLPEAMFNFLLLLGWHPKEDKEVVSRDAAIKEFTLQRVQKGGATFTEERLEWFNSHYIKESSPDELLPHIKAFIPPSWAQKKELLKKAIAAEKQRMKRLSEFKELADFFFRLPPYESKLLIWDGKEPESKENLKKIYHFLKQLPEDSFTREKIEGVLASLSEDGGKGEVYWPLRVALSGKRASPGATEIITVLGKKETMRRLTKALEKLA